MPKVDLFHYVPIAADRIKSPLSALSVFNGTRPMRLSRDRFNRLNKYSLFDYTDRTDPIAPNVDIDIAEEIDRRANEFVRRSCTISWSGGIDSTVVLLALIKNGIHKNDLEIVYDEHSMLEYPNLFRKLSQKGFCMRRFSDKREWLALMTETAADVILSGRCADYHMTPSLWLTRHDPEGLLYFEPIERFLATNRFFFGTLSVEEAFSYADIYRETARDLFGIELKTLADLSWFGTFCLAYDRSVKYDKLHLLGTRSENKPQTFFDTLNFQSWGISNFERISATNCYQAPPENFKKELKSYCHHVFPDEQYLFYKNKVPSWKSGNISEIGNGNKSFVILFDDGTHLRHNIPIEKADSPFYFEQYISQYRKQTN